MKDIYKLCFIIKSNFIFNFAPGDKNMNSETCNFHFDS